VPAGTPSIRQTNIQLTRCHTKVVNLTHAHLIAIQNQWDLTRMRKDSQFAAEIQRKIGAGKEERSFFNF
jgi:hypothetical protein